MAPTRIFITGTTGYIGGDAFFAIHKAHPEFDYHLLVRNHDQAKKIQEKYPGANIHFAFGNLDSADVIEKEAAGADIVLHTADSSDHVPSAKAIAKGLAAEHSADKPGYWLHICGTGILMWYDETHKRYGQPPIPEETYDDVKDIDRVVNLPDQAFHRDVDKIVLGANSSSGVKTAIIGPPTIYGPGRGPVNQRSRQVYDMAKYTLQNGFAPIVGTGKTKWDNVHVHDLSDLLVSLVDVTLDPKRNQDPELFGPKAYFFCEHGVHVWGEVARQIADEAVRQGYLPEPATKVVDLQSLADQSWGQNSRSIATRARKYLGWKPTGRVLRDEIPDVVTGEAEALGLTRRTPKH